MVEFEALERKMLRTKALYKELNALLDTEYEAGKIVNKQTIEKLNLRKNNCINRLGNLVNDLGCQLKEMNGNAILPNNALTLQEMIRSIPKLPPEKEDDLIFIARVIEQSHTQLLDKAERNTVLLKGILNKFKATSKYAGHGRTI